MALLEVCVDSVAGLRAALQGGADRIELCAALAVGGLTPSAGLMQAAAGSPVPVMAMIRHRPGDFVHTAADIDAAIHDISAARAAGMSGVVIGASLPDGRLDEAALQQLMRAAGRMDVTLHRCFDLVPDVAEALEVMRRVKIRRVLTSGGALSVDQGLDRLRDTLALAGRNITVMPGSGVTLKTLPHLRLLRVKEVHASCAAPILPNAAAARLGFASDSDRSTDASKVAALKAALV